MVFMLFFPNLVAILLTSSSGHDRLVPMRYGLHVSALTSLPPYLPTAKSPPPPPPPIWRSQKIINLEDSVEK